MSTATSSDRAADTHNIAANLNNVKIQNNVHNKGFVFDHKTVVVSSMNWSGEGVLSNRDAGVIIENATAAAYYEKLFLDDWTTHAEQNPSVSCTGTARFIRAKFVMNNYVSSPD